MKDDAQEKIQQTRLVWLVAEETLRRRSDKFSKKKIRAVLNRKKTVCSLYL